MTRDDLIAMLREQTSACGPARDALRAGGDFVVWEGPVPANRHAGVFRLRMRSALRRGHTIDGLAESVDILKGAGEELLRTGCTDAVDKSSVFTIFLNSTATVVVALPAAAGADSPPLEPGRDRWNQRGMVNRPFWPSGQGCWNQLVTRALE
ncbi:hypothetical protein [Streptomyces melanogenes]|uniref:hypothetical protein n=1 Tax=Streptomyces melanogenes TaxID=67326 RepID=UPI00167C4633|nr:hypothetical protein [Streptomyces melanogenes]